MKYPAVQVALDFVTLDRALRSAQEAADGGCALIEAGTPLIKSEGLDSVRELRKRFPKKIIVADMKIMDAGRVEVECAAKAGADIITVLAASTDQTIAECVEAANNYGAQIQADLIGVENPVSRAKQMENLGVHIIGVHCAIDEQMHGKDPFDTLKKISKAVKTKLSVAGGINSETAHIAVKSGASIVIVGGAIIKAVSPGNAARKIVQAIKQDKPLKTDYFKRGKLGDVTAILKKVSTSNVSDAMHRAQCLAGIAPLKKGMKLSGKTVTVRTYPGDWAKPVQAVDAADPGDILVVDAGGVGPSVWGELATHGAIQKKIGGIVVNGSVRDSEEIIKSGLPVFTKLVMPNAGEPKGFGEINVPVTISGIKIFPGDYLIGDDDGICVIPEKDAVEIANRAMDILEAENRLRREIDQGSTLGKIAELLRWEKKR